jgi:hypothetical protein
MYISSWVPSPNWVISWPQGYQQTTSAVSAAKLPATMVDGTSGVILFSEAFANCNFSYMEWFNANTTPGSRPSATFPAPTTQPQPLVQPHGVYPLPQWFPDAGLCNSGLLQSHQVGGILVALADGSCRVVSENVSVLAWTAAVIPNDRRNPGDVAGGGW